MKTLHPTTPWMAPLALAACLTLVAGCGGGGSSDSSGSTSTTPTTPATPASVRLAGVAAIGAPLADARLRVLDGSGQVLASTTTAADGSYALTLSTPKAPLLLQAAGHDARGLPVVLHAAVNTLSASLTAHVTPLTDAAVALSLGAEPRGVFSAAAGDSTVLAPLARVGAAADLVKTLVKANLSDARFTDTTKLDLVSDPGLSANKTGQDLALEVLSVGLGTDPRGGAQLQLGNKLAANPVEVTVDLATAASELAKTTGATPANAITSSTKATSSARTVAANLAVLDDLATALNKVIAENPTGNASTVASALDKAALRAKYTRQDGGNGAALAARLAGWAGQRMQLGRLQVTGCADEVVAASGCTRVSVAARVSNAGGDQVDSFIDTVAWDTSAKPAARWALTGNDMPAAFAATAVAWRARAADGSASTLTGVRLQVGTPLKSASVQTPGGYVLPLASCARPSLCVLPTSATPVGATGTAPATSVTAAGTLADDSVFSGVNLWLAPVDTALGARWKASLVADDATGTTSTRSALLRGVHVGAPAAARHPALDTSPDSASLLAGTAVTWATWAAAHIDQRLLLVRRLVTLADGSVLIVDASPARWTDTSLALAAVPVPAGARVTNVALWLVAVDSAGRLLVSSL